MKTNKEYKQLLKNLSLVKATRGKLEKSDTENYGVAVFDEVTGDWILTPNNVTKEHALEVLESEIKMLEKEVRRIKSKSVWRKTFFPWKIY